MARILRSNLASIALVTAVAAYGWSRYPQLPETVATHFDLAGNPNGYSGRAFLLLFIPLMTLALMLILPALVIVSLNQGDFGKSSAAARAGKQVPRICFVLTVLMCAIQLGMLEANLPNPSRPLQFYLGLGFAFVLVGLGLMMAKTERNPVFGIRVSWTLASESNWAATHRFAGRAMVASGLVCVAVAFLSPSIAASVALLLAGTLAPVPYSYWYHRRHERA